MPTKSWIKGIACLILAGVGLGGTLGTIWMSSEAERHKEEAARARPTPLRLDDLSPTPLGVMARRREAELPGHILFLWAVLIAVPIGLAILSWMLLAHAGDREALVTTAVSLGVCVFPFLTFVLPNV